MHKSAQSPSHRVTARKPSSPSTAVDEIMTESTLSAMYGIPVDVEQMGGHRIVLARPGVAQGRHDHA